MASSLDPDTVVPTIGRYATVEDVDDSESVDFESDTSLDSMTSTSRNSPDDSRPPSITEEVLISRAAEVLNLGRASLTSSRQALARANNPHLLVMPKNFGQVMAGVYRSGYPGVENVAFFRMLGIKTVLALTPEPYDDALRQSVSENGIQQFQVGIEKNKSPFLTINQCNMSAAQRVVLNRANHPLLIHCNKGKHRTGCVVACLRKILGWDLDAILEEYRLYAGAKARVLDERYIELFNAESLSWMARSENFLPPVASTGTIGSIPEPFSESPITSHTVSTRLRG